jgi:DNA-binding CsgD family transcriptional regulator
MSIVARGHSAEPRVSTRRSTGQSCGRNAAGGGPRQLLAGELESLLRGLIDALVQQPPTQPEDLPVSFEIEEDGLQCLVLVEATGPLEGTLSPREEEIARMVALGYQNKTIAATLGISTWTVSTHLRRMFAKFGVSSRAALVASVLEERHVHEGRRVLRR